MAYRDKRRHNEPKHTNSWNMMLNKARTHSTCLAAARAANNDESLADLWPSLRACDDAFNKCSAAGALQRLLLLSKHISGAFACPRQRLRDGDAVNVGVENG